MSYVDKNNGTNEDEERFDHYINKDSDGNEVDYNAYNNYTKISYIKAYDSIKDKCGNEEIAINYSDYSDFVSVLDFEKLELDNYLKEVPDEKYENLMKECDWNNRLGQIMQVITEKGLV